MRLIIMSTLIMDRSLMLPLIMDRSLMLPLIMDRSLTYAYKLRASDERKI
jgi:hypothetical protein